jgi:hypothetical protein
MSNIVAIANFAMLMALWVLSFLEDLRDAHANKSCNIGRKTSKFGGDIGPDGIRRACQISRPFFLQVSKSSSSLGLAQNSPCLTTIDLLTLVKRLMIADSQSLKFQK